MEHGLYRKIDRNKCRYCDHPNWCPSKKINAKNKCKQCRKNSTKRNKKQQLAVSAL
jgi:hypothetical protein